MNFNVTEFYVIFTYRELLDSVHEHNQETCIENFADQVCTLCQGEFGDEDLDLVEKFNQRLAVTPCYHIFHEQCLKDYITTIFRFYLARKYAIFNGVLIQVQNDNGELVEAPGTLTHPVGCPIPHFSDSRLGRVVPGAPIYNPFGHAIAEFGMPNRQLECPICHHNLDEEMNANTAESRCFRRYFQRTGKFYPHLIPRYTFQNDNHVDGINPYYRLLPGVAMWEAIIRDRHNINTDFYRIPDRNNHVNDYFNLPQIQAYYAANQNEERGEFVHIDEEPVARAGPRAEIGELGDEPDEEVLAELPEAMPVHPLALAGKECGPRYGPADRRWTRPELVDLARQAGITMATINSFNIPQLCNVLRNFRRAGAAPARAPEAAVAAVAAAVAADIPGPAALPICRDGRPRGRDARRDLTVETAKHLASQHGLDNRGSKRVLCHRLIHHVPPYARRPYADEGRRTKRNRRPKRVSRNKN